MKIYEKVLEMQQWIKRNRRAIFIIFVISLFTYFPFLTDVLSNPDGVMWWDNYIKTPLWILGQGRWGYYIIDYIKPPISLSVLSVFWNLGAYTLGSVLFSELLGAKHSFQKVIVGSCVLCFPIVGCTNTYWGCPFSFAFLLAVLSVAITVKMKTTSVGIIAGSICLSVSIGMHQGNLGIAAAAGIMYLILFLLQEPEKFRDWLISVRNVLIMGLGGVVLYYLILQVQLRKYGMQLQSFAGGDKISLY